MSSPQPTTSRPTTRARLNRTKSFETGPVRARLNRNKSFESMRNLLPRSLSFSNRKHVRKSNIMEDERNVFASDIVSEDFVLGKLMEVNKETKVIKLEVEDLLVSQHATVLPVVKALTTSGKREWQWVRFADTVDLDEFPMWYEKKQAIMREFETSVESTALYKNIVSFKATLRFAQGTSVKTFQKILKTLQADASISKLRFGGSLDRSDLSLVPAMLKNTVAGKELGDAVSITLTSGWSCPTASLEWKTLITNCLFVLDSPEKQEATPFKRTPVRRVKTDNGRPSIPLPRGNTVKRKVQSDESLPPLPRQNMVLQKVPSDESLPLSRRSSTRRTISMPLRDSASRGRRSGIDADALLALKEVGRRASTRKARRRESGLSTATASTTCSSNSSSRSTSPVPTKVQQEVPDYDWQAGVAMKNSRTSTAA